MGACSPSSTVGVSAKRERNCALSDRRGRPVSARGAKKRHKKTMREKLSPSTLSETEPAGAALPTSRAGRAPSHPAHILVVDNDPDVGDVLQRCLQDAGFAVSGAQSGAEARRVLDHAAVDLALIDVVMPGEGGLSLAEYAKRIGVEVILMTGEAESMTVLDGLAYRAIYKPFRLAELRRMIQATLRPLPQQARSA
jgi:CheY-like chemotaxis protein